MYAQCPECLTFFRLKPSHLKAAQGRVRCSRCKHVFNALETLRDELSPEEIAAVEATRRREPGENAPLLDEEHVGDLFDDIDPELGELFSDEIGTEAGEETGEDPGEQANGPDTGDTPPFIEHEPDEPEVSDVPVRETPGFAPAPARRRHPGLLVAANLLLLLALAVQVVHWQRFAILEHAVAGKYLARAYAALGAPLEPPLDLAAVRVLRTEVSSHPDHPRALHMTAVIENTADTTQPWPELHVDLQDRWGETVASRHFTPAEYLREPREAAEPFAPGTRHAIELAIVDPGVAAVGFQVEPCFSNGERRVCAADINEKN